MTREFDGEFLYVHCPWEKDMVKVFEKCLTCKFFYKIGGKGFLYCLQNKKTP